MSKPSSRGKPLAHAAEPDDDVAQRAVVEVDDPLPGDGPRVDAERVAVVHVVVDQRGEQVVRGRDGGEVTGEVQVDVGHRHDLGVAAAGRAALHAEHRTHRRLAQARPSPSCPAVAARRRGRPRSSSCPRRPAWATSPSSGSGVPSGRSASEREVGQRRPSPWCGRTATSALRLDAELLGGDVGDRPQIGGVGDLDVGQHGRAPSVYSRSPGHTTPRAVTCLS